MHTKRFNTFFKRWVQFRVAAIPWLPNISYFEGLRDLCLLSFIGIELSLGIYFPAIGTLRGYLVPEKQRQIDSQIYRYIDIQIDSRQKIDRNRAIPRNIFPCNWNTQRISSTRKIKIDRQLDRQQIESRQKIDRNRAIPRNIFPCYWNTQRLSSTRKTKVDRQLDCRQIVREQIDSQIVDRQLDSIQIVRQQIDSIQKVESRQNQSYDQDIFSCCWNT